MTRRRIVFIDKSTNKTYITSEFNGDKEEFWKFKAGDTCNMYWQTLLDVYFANVKTLEDFKIANEKAQKEYISNITGTSSILPIEEVVDIKSYKSTYGDKLYFIDEKLSLSLKSRINTIKNYLKNNKFIAPEFQNVGLSYMEILSTCEYLRSIGILRKRNCSGLAYEFIDKENQNESNKKK